MATIIDSLLISIGIDANKAKEGFQALQVGAQKVDTEFNRLSSRWAGVIQGLVSTVIAPVAGAFAIGKVVNSYMSDISNVAAMTGAYSQKLEEWRIKRAMLQRVTKEDIELYKNGREAIVGFNIAMADLGAKLMRSFMPVMKTLVEGLNTFTAWMNRNQDNIVRFLTVTAGVISTVFLPSLLKMGAALLANPLTWIVGALGLLALVIDDLVTYIQGGQTAMSGLWSIFGSGEEILTALTKAFDIFKSVMAVLWKPLAAVASAFAAFKIGSVLVQGVTTAITSLRMAMTALAANPLIAALTLIISLFTWIIDVLQRVNGDWSQVWGVMKQDTLDFLNLFGGLGDKLAAFFADFIAPLDALVSIVGNICAAVWQSFKLLWSYLIGSSVEVKDAIAAALWDALGGIGQGVLDLINSIVDSILSLGNKLGTALLNIGQGLLALISTMFNGAINLIISFFSFLDSALAQLGTWLLSGASKALSSVSNAVNSAITQVLSAISSAFGSAFNAISELVSSVSGAIGDAFTAIGQTLQGWGQTLVQSLSALVSGAFTFIVGFFNAIGSTVRELFDSVITIAQGLANAINTSLKQAFQAVIAAVQGLITSLANAAQKLVTTVGNSLSAIYNALVSVISNAVGFISECVQAALVALQSLGNIVYQVFALVQAGVARALQAFSDLFNRVILTIRTTLQGLNDLVSSIVAMVNQGLTQAFAFLSSWFARIATTVRSALGSALSLVQGLWQRLLVLVQSGVSRLSALLNNIGATLSSLWQSIAASVSGFFSQALSKVTSLLSSIPALVSSVFTNVQSLISNAFAAALEAAQEFFSTVFSFLSAIPAKLAAAFDIGGMIDKATAGIKDKLSHTWDGVTSFFGFGGKDKDKDNTGKASAGALASSQDVSTFGRTIQALEQNAPMLSNPPVTANHTNLVTNNNYAKNHNEQRSANVVNNTININTTADPRDIARAVGRELPNDSGNNYVSAAESANWSMT